jgi:DNA-binding IscR family transcriptional regulator
LRKPAEEIRVDRVVADFEGRSGVLACVAEPTVCVLEPGCVLRHALMDAENAFYDTLGKLTIADAVEPRSTQSSDQPSGPPSGGVYNLTIRRASVLTASPSA